MKSSNDSTIAYEVVAGTPISLEAHDEPKAAEARPCILLVEDSPTTLRLLSKPLSERYSLLVAGDGTTAWELVQTHPEIELVKIGRAHV